MIAGHEEDSAPASSLHPDAVAFLEVAAAAMPPLSDDTLPQMRAAFSAAALAYEPSALAVTEDVAGERTGGPDLRIYRPPHVSGLLPVVLFLHGGGFVSGGIDSHDGLCHDLSTGLTAIVVAVDYRLAPEHPFPAALDDAVTGLRWIAANEESMQADVQRIGVAGDSAGGGIAAVLAAGTADLPVELRAQLLMYPALDLTSSLPSHARFARGFGLDAQTVAYCYRAYCAGADPSDPRLSPRLSADLSRAAPAVLVVGDHDPLYCEAVDYAALLAAAGVPAELIERPGMIHGFLSMNRFFGDARPTLDAFVAAGRRLLVAT